MFVFAPVEKVKVKQTKNEVCCQRSVKWTNQITHSHYLHWFFSVCVKWISASWWKTFRIHEYKVRVGDVFTSCEFIQYIPKLFQKLGTIFSPPLHPYWKCYYIENFIYFFHFRRVTFCDSWFVIFAPIRAWILVKITERSQWVNLFTI